MRSFALLALFGLSTPAFAVPATFTHQGSLSGPDGLPLTGVHAMTFRLYGEVSGGSPVWMGTYAPRFDAGVYAVEIGGSGTTPIDSGLLSAYPLWLELEVDGVVLSPRQPLTSVPYASVAGVAERLEGGAVDATGLSVNGLEVVDADGRWVGEAPATTWSSVAGVPAELLDGDADTLAGISCVDGSVLTVVAGTWACGSALDAAAVGALMDARNLATQADLDALALACDALSGEVDDLDGRVTVLEDGALALSGSVSALNGRVTTLEAGALALTGRVSTVEAAATGLGGRVSTLEGLTDADTLAGLSCADGEMASWDATLGEWGCAADRVLTEAEVDAYVADNGYASASSVTSVTTRVGALESGATALGGRVSTLEGASSAAHSDILALQADVADLQIDVATDAGLLATLGANVTSLLTNVSSLGTRVTTLEATVAGLVASSFSGSFLDLDDVPAGLADGDDDTLGELSCADGEVAQFDAATGSWGCGDAAVGSAITSGARTLASGDSITLNGAGAIFLAQGWERSTDGTWEPIEVVGNPVCTECGTGALGDLVYGTGSHSIVGGEYNVRNFTLPAGATLRVTGTQPLILRATGLVTIAGTVDASGYQAVGRTGGVAGPGGYAGGNYGGPGWCVTGAVVPRGSPGYFDPPTGYSSGWLTTIASARGGCGGGGDIGSAYYQAGGGGGGAVAVAAAAISVSGSILANGGGSTTSSLGGLAGGGGGGMIWLRAADVHVTGTLSVAGAGGGPVTAPQYGGVGQVRIDARDGVFSISGYTGGSTTGLMQPLAFGITADGELTVSNHSVETRTVIVGAMAD